MPRNQVAAREARFKVQAVKLHHDLYKVRPAIYVCNSRTVLKLLSVSSLVRNALRSMAGYLRECQL